MHTHTHTHTHTHIYIYCTGSVHAQDIYKYTRMSIDPKAGLTRYDVPRGLSTIMLT